MGHSTLCFAANGLGYYDRHRARSKQHHAIIHSLGLKWIRILYWLLAESYGPSTARRLQTSNSAESKRRRRILGEPPSDGYRPATMAVNRVVNPSLICLIYPLKRSVIPDTSVCAGGFCEAICCYWLFTRTHCCFANKAKSAADREKFIRVCRLGDIRVSLQIGFADDRFADLRR
jgi:hypothetical protein